MVGECGKEEERKSGAGERVLREGAGERVLERGCWREGAGERVLERRREEEEETTWLYAHLYLGSSVTGLP